MKQGGVAYSDCVMNLMENKMITSLLWRMWNKSEQNSTNGLSSQHVGNISSLYLCIYFVCVYSQIVTLQILSSYSVLV